MKKTLFELYNIEFISLIKKSDNAFIVETKNDKYVLKYIDKALESIFIRLFYAASNYFVLPIKSKNNKYIEYYNSSYFALFPYYEDDLLSSKDMRLSIYIKGIGELHNNSTYQIVMEDSYFADSLSYLDEKISLIEEELLTRIRVEEKSEYHSPSSWYFLNNYLHFKNALKEATIFYNKLEEAYKNEKDLSLSLTYQNFNFDHIIIKHSKIISIDKMVLAPSIFDLYDLFLNFSLESISLKKYIEEYIKIHPLKDYEKYWLCALLFIPIIKRKNNELEEIKELKNTLKYIKNAEEISLILNG